MGIPSDLDIEERMACALPRDWPQDYREHGDHPNACVSCGNVFKGNPKRTECRVCANGHHTLEDLCR
jgi:hypothetical protein